jgi:hypothetical protein
MSFKLTIEVPDTKLSATMRLLHGHKVMVESTEKYVPGWDDPRKKTNGTRLHSRADSLLTMTGKEPNKNSKLSKAKEVFEKLEKRMGIGNVNAAAFRIELTKKKLSKGLAQRCVTEKVLSYLP